MENTKWILKFVKIIKWSFALGLLFTIIKTVSNLSLIAIQKFIIDDVFIESKYHLLVYLLSFFCLAIFTFNLFHILAARILDKNAFRLNRILSKSLLAKLQKLPTEVIQNERTAKFVNNFTGDIEAVARMISINIPELVQHFFTAVILTIFIGVASPVILILVVVLSICYIFIVKYYTNRIKAHSAAVLEKRTELLVNIEESVSATREVLAYNREKWEEERYKKNFSQYFSEVKKESGIINKQIISSQSLKWAALFIILAYGGYLVMTDQLSLGMFVVIYQFSTQLMDSFQTLYDFVMKIPINMASVDRLKSVMDKEQLNDGNIIISQPIESIKFKDVSFKYSDLKENVLDEMSIDIPINKKIGIVGSSGSGKSTIAQLLLMNYKANKGEILINGTEINDLNRNGWTNKITIVFQDPYFYPDTILNNILMGSEQHSIEEIIKVCRIAHIHEFISSLDKGYETQVGERGILLSGGQRQRIALARALLRNPEILIIDEGTSALDLETERKVLRDLDEFRKDRTTIIIAHRLSTIQNSDLILVVDKGRIVGKGSHNTLLNNNSSYSRLTNIV
ncbi:ABC transporter ATP-binding protein [Cytobacillus sp. FSL R5-0377]|uniref:ABC transporter ATP-binding protein n=1 Tax=Cytobacillus sp. FSL R5-0377 TaxID=2954543 RepID=UPI00135C463E|nr:Lipid A export ATP-binding/permease protein MsbA [Bacillus sp. ZZV12-4809]MCM3094269.1 ABC transporter ATP-binding protein/permease [Cytobacillus sp. AMY 15.2]